MGSRVDDVPKKQKGTIDYAKNTTLMKLDLETWMQKEMHASQELAR